MGNDLLTTYQDAEKKGVAVGHFNVSDLTTLKGVVDAAQELKVPVIIGASEGERQFLGDHQLAALVRSYRDETGLPIFLNADHTHTLEKAVSAAKAGFDSIVFDLSALHIEENIQKTKELEEKRQKLLEEEAKKAHLEGFVGRENDASGRELLAGFTEALRSRGFGRDVLEVPADPPDVQGWLRLQRPLRSWASSWKPPIGIHRADPRTSRASTKTRISEKTPNV